MLDSLLELLRSLSPEDWDKPTVCEGWSVKDVALHLLGGEIGNVSRRRDGHLLSAHIETEEALVAYINAWNAGWVEASRRISPRLLIDLLGMVGPQMNDYVASLDPNAIGDPVSWAGPNKAPVWLDIAREYTERWHHQQHIRDAVGKPGLKDPQWMSPALATFVWAMPHAYRDLSARDGATVTLTIQGRSGGQWSILKGSYNWRLVSGATEKPSAEVILPDDVAWRLFTKGLSEDAARKQMTVQGDITLGLTVLQMTSIIA